MPRSMKKAKLQTAVGGFFCFVLAACGSTNEFADSPQRHRVPVEKLLDIEYKLPKSADGVDLGEMFIRPASACDAVSNFPTRWLTSAIIPIQMWVDAFRSIDPPTELRTQTELLLTFGDAQVAWNFKKQPTRPEFSMQHEKAAEDILVWGAAHCQLPLALGRADQATDSETGEWINAEWCTKEKERVQSELDRFRAAHARDPVHQEQMALSSDTYYSSDEFGLATNDEGRMTPIAIPNIGCDKF